MPAQVYMDSSQDGTELHKEDLRRWNDQLDTSPGIFMILGPTENPTRCLYDAGSSHTAIIPHAMALVWGIRTRNKCAWSLTGDDGGNCLYKLALKMGFRVDELKQSTTKQQKTCICMFLDASKAFDCINHWKPFQILLERRCPVYILVLVFWYEEQMLCVKWSDSLSECFSVSNGIKQGGILSTKLFNIYVDVLSQGLTSKPVGCSFNGKIINHLYYVHDLVLIAPSSNGMHKLVTECESFANKYRLKFNEMKSIVIF